ncbi:MAG: DUF4065 domain-containing protein [Bergeyella sp.]|nr:DUF4065 domain-containing protein [Bergeyella sp.]
MEKVLTIAQYMYDKGYHSNLQLNKLVYFSFGFFGAYHKKMHLFDSKIEAWKYGPVVREVYEAFKKGDFDKHLYKADLPDEEKKTIDWVLDFYGEKAPFLLVELTHQKDTPWSRFYEEDMNKEIPKDFIISYYTDFVTQNEKIIKAMSSESFASVMQELAKT